MNSDPLTVDELRTALQERIAMSFEFEGHAARLEELRGQFHHSVSILPFDEPLQDCNCVMYALDFRLPIPSSPLGCFYANTVYLRWLIDQGLLVEAPQPEKGLLSIYCDADKIAHIGVVLNGGRIASKWGIGFLYEHALWEVPSNYGSVVRYFYPIDPGQALAALKTYHTGQ